MASPKEPLQISQGTHTTVMTCSMLRSPAPSPRPAFPLGWAPPLSPYRPLPAATAPHSACGAMLLPLNRRGESRPPGRTRYVRTANPHSEPPLPGRARIPGYVSSASLIVNSSCDARAHRPATHALCADLMETPIFGARASPRYLNCTIVDRCAGMRTHQRVVGNMSPSGVSALSMCIARRTSAGDDSEPRDTRQQMVWHICCTPFK